MPVYDLQALIDRIELRNFFIPVRIRRVIPEPRSTAQEMLQIDLGVPDRDTGLHATIGFPLGLNTQFMSERDVVDKIRHAIAIALKHELDEAFHFDGERIYDPHRVEEKHLTPQ